MGPRGALQHRHGPGGDPIANGQEAGHAPVARLGTLGLVLFGLASGGLAVLGEARFLFLVDAGWLHIPAALAVAVVGHLGLQRVDRRLLVGATALGLAVLASASAGIPTLAGWALAILGGLGLVAYVENAVLVLRLEHVKRAEGGEESLRRLAKELRRAELRPLLAVGGLVLLCVLLARGVLLVLDRGLAASLEAGSGYGLALMTMVVAGLMLAYRRARGTT